MCMLECVDMCVWMVVSMNGTVCVSTYMCMLECVDTCTCVFGW